MGTYQTPAERYQEQQSAEYRRELDTKAKWSEDRQRAQAERVEEERIEASRAKIIRTVSALYFAERSVERLQREYDAFLKQDPCTRVDTRLKEALHATKSQVQEFTAYLDEQRTAGQPYTREEIDAEVERFAYSQGGPERLAKAVHAAEVRNLKDAQPQPSQGKPAITFPCPRCGSALNSLTLAMHKNGDGWCTINPRKAYASGRDVYWLITEGGCSVSELQSAGIAIPEALLT
jgi:hypothetical protein